MIFIKDKNQSVPFMCGYAFTLKTRRRGLKRVRKVYVLMPFNLPIRAVAWVAVSVMRAGEWMQNGKD